MTEVNNEVLKCITVKHDKGQVNDTFRASNNIWMPWQGEEKLFLIEEK